MFRALILCIALIGATCLAQEPAGPSVGDPAPQQVADKKHIDPPQSDLRPSPTPTLPPVISQPGQPDTANPSRDAQEENLKQADLNAQTSMADAAWSMFKVSVIQAVVGIFGLAAIIITLRQTKDAITIERQFGDAQLRPWVSLAAELRSGWTPGTTHDGIRGFYLNVFVTARNHGETPATRVSIAAELAPSGGNVTEGIEVFARRQLDRRSFKHGQIIFPNMASGSLFSLFVSEESVAACSMDSNGMSFFSPWVLCAITYETSHSKSLCQTFTAFGVVRDGPKGPMVFETSSSDWHTHQIGLSEFPVVSAT